MAVKDLQIFIQSLLRAYDETIDLTSGAPADVNVVQPLLRRLGTDPFTVDMSTFLTESLRQAFPELATDEGDALTDLLVKPATLLWDPIVREIFRIRVSQSFKDPTTLTTDEADALGANLFSERNRGDFARGAARIYFTAPRNVSITPVNFFTSKTGLHFFPDGKQDITTEEMLLNADGSLYYFDVNLIAESPGIAYNIGPREIITVANLEGTARVVNLRKFRSGQDEETATEFVDRAQQELTERSMVTLRGIGARIPRAFPEVTRLAVVGFGDPEMQRDVLQGGGLGEVLAGGMLGQTALDGTGKPTTRRFQVLDAGVDFTALIGDGSYVLTVFSAFSGPPFVRDLAVSRVISSNTVEVASAELLPFYASRPWSLRKRELTLSGIPGGILFPDSANGTVTIPDDTVHVGGHYDVSVRGSDFDEATLVIENLTDASPAAAGTQLSCPSPGLVFLEDLKLGVTYAVGDSTYVALGEAKQYGFTLQIVDGPNAGNYRVLDVSQVSNASPLLRLDVATPIVAGLYRWRLIDTLDIDLLDPRDTRVVGSDLQAVQNTDILTTAGGTDFTELGVSVGDVVRIADGLNKGDYSVLSVPSFATVKVDRTLVATASALNYEIFRANSAGGVQLPLVRITKVELLDTSGQPVGSTIPYARAIDVQSRAFENPGRGVKADLVDARLGILSQPQPGGGFLIGGQTLTIKFRSGITAYPDVTVTFSAGNKSAAQAVAEINAAASLTINSNTVLATLITDPVLGNRVGIVPIDPYTVVETGTGLAGFFGDSQAHTSLDIRSDAIDAIGGWAAVSPAINQDDLDVAQVLDGNQIGFYGSLVFGSAALGDPLNTALLAGDRLRLDTLAAFAPEIGRRLQVGSRSIGSARCYFLEPTTVEFSTKSRFSTTLSDGSVVRFFPDPTLDAVRVPAAPSTVLPKDGTSSGGGNVFTSLSQDFILSGVVPGDELIIKYVPIVGSVVLSDPVPSVALLSVVISVDDSPDKTIILASDVAGFPTSVSRSGIANQINAGVGKVVATISGTGRLEFEGDVAISVRGTGSANSILGLGTVDQFNRAKHAGPYVILNVAQTSLTLDPASPFPPPVTESREAYEIRRPGTQRVSTTQMASNTAEAGLYYFDVELVSEGTGDLYNIDSDLQLTAENYRSDGYYLTTDDPNVTFSSVEKPKLHISRTIMEAGVSDNLANATQITGQNIAITYERSTLVADTQNFALSETERVVCANPLARHLIPHFVRYDFEYVGGSRADKVVADHQEYIRGLYPSDFLESSDLVNLAYKNGASSVSSPISLIAVVHNYDRTVTAQRSQDSLNTGRLAAFVADVINVNRRSG